MIKALAGVSIRDELASEFVRRIRWFDREPPGCTIMLNADDQIPISADQLRSTCARLAPGRPAIDPRRFDRDCRRI
jgi:hypothetical protein